MRIARRPDDPSSATSLSQPDGGPGRPGKGATHIFGLALLSTAVAFGYWGRWNLAAVALNGAVFLLAAGRRRSKKPFAELEAAAPSCRRPPSAVRRGTLGDLQRLCAGCSLAANG